MRKWTTKAGIGPVMAAVAVVFAGCDLEVINPGSIQDADLSTPELMPILVAGVSAEYNDIGDTFAFDGGRLTDDMAGTGSYFGTQQFRQGIFDDLDSETPWEQAHEAAWAAGEAWTRLVEVLEAGANSSVDSAKLFALMGHAHNRLGENFCDVVYDVGGPQPRTAAFDSAIVAFNQALTIAGAAGGGADHWAMSARAGLAQAYLGKGDWANAVNWASQVPIDFVDNAIYNAQANQNEIWQESHGRAEVGVWTTLAQRLYDGPDGDPTTTADGDPRTPYIICGAWDDPDPVNPDPSAGVTATGDCAGAHQGADGLTAHYRQEKYDERGSDIPRASGVEMQLIIAEDRLINGTLAEFIAEINTLRAEYGLAPRAQPATVGSLDFPYADPADDAWSIMDEERYATLWMTGKRLYDLDRWNHPFLDGGFLATNVPGASAIARRVSCMPVPRNECELNPNLVGASFCS